MSNRKQNVFAFLDSTTEKELDDYIDDRKINNRFNCLLEQIKRTKPRNHAEKIYDSIGKKIGESIHEYYKFGQAHIIAYVLECFYDDKCKIEDLKYYLKEIIKNDKELKEYVYECMKDY